MEVRTLRSDSLLLLAATLWGFAFVAQRVGMEYVGPFTFNGVRFALGSLSLLPLLLLAGRNVDRGKQTSASSTFKALMLGGGLAGFAVFMGASLQQIGLVYTTAGKAGFITGLYVVIVPFLGLFVKQRPSSATWLGAILAAVGLYLLSIGEEFTISPGDFLELLGAFFWAAHVLILGWLSPKIHTLRLAFFQNAICSVLSLLAASLSETVKLDLLLQAAMPILYGGLVSVGVAYTLQVVAQRDAHPAHAAIILSLEAVVAAFGGWVLLNESLSLRGLLGCGFMLSGMLFSQVCTNRAHPRPLDS